MQKLVEVKLKELNIGELQASLTQSHKNMRMQKDITIRRLWTNLEKKKMN